MKNGGFGIHSIIPAAALLFIAATAFNASAQTAQLVRGGLRELSGAMTGRQAANTAAKTAEAAAQVAAREALRPAVAGAAIPAAGGGITDGIVKCFGNKVRGSLGRLNKDQSITMTRFGGEYGRLPAPHQRRVLDAFKSSPAAFADKLRNLEKKIGKTGALCAAAGVVVIAGNAAGEAFGQDAGTNGGGGNPNSGWLSGRLAKWAAWPAGFLMGIIRWDWIGMMLLAAAALVAIIAVGPLKTASLALSVAGRLLGGVLGMMFRRLRRARASR